MGLPRLYHVPISCPDSTPTSVKLQGSHEGSDLMENVDSSAITTTSSSSPGSAQEIRLCPNLVLLASRLEMSTNLEEAGPLATVTNEKPKSSDVETNLITKTCSALSLSPVSANHSSLPLIPAEHTSSSDASQPAPTTCPLVSLSRSASSASVVSISSDISEVPTEPDLDAQANEAFETLDNLEYYQLRQGRGPVVDWDDFIQAKVELDRLGVRVRDYAYL
ncbi:hypothetical protein VKT23_016885 [Stygiomarasmius scandens]|uniref:Uncharacterized protein n=1 Tax=Marasmiellus scandens TaxID=2682957 RepID=A0ABR1ITT5_9AGAR